jgi:4a-hydroxytetrahydrobiopterin dehydratase
MPEKLTGWEVADGRHLHKIFKFPDFAKALDFVNRIGAAAEEQGHHPDILLGWGKVEVTLFTHDINGVSDKDYKLAAAIDKLS